MEINGELLYQKHQLRLSINEGVAVDARLVKSASRSVFNKQLDEFKKKAEAPEGSWISMLA